MKLNYGKNFERLLAENLEDIRGRSFEESGFPSMTMELKGGTKIKHFFPKLEGYDEIKIGGVDYLLKIGSEAEVKVYDIDNILIDEKGLKITLNKGNYHMMKGVIIHPRSEGKEPEDIVSRKLMDGPLEASFVAVRPKELKENKVYRWIKGRKHYMLPKKDLTEVSLQERIGGTGEMNVFQIQKGFYLNHRKAELSSLYPIVSF